MDTLSTPALCAMLVGQLMLVILIRCCAIKYCNNNNVARLICILCTLAFFNLSIAYIFGPILLCKNIAFAVATVGREVHVCLLCTILYLYHLLIIRQGPVYFGVYEFSTLASLGGCALGARLGFRTMHAFIQMCFSDFNFFFISFVICILILIYLYIFISFFFDFFLINKKFLNYLFLFLFLFALSFFFGLYMTTICAYISTSTLIPYATFTIFK